MLQSINFSSQRHCYRIAHFRTNVGNVGNVGNVWLVHSHRCSNDRHRRFLLLVRTNSSFFCLYFLFSRYPEMISLAWASNGHKQATPIIADDFCDSFEIFVSLDSYQDSRSYNSLCNSLQFDVYELVILTQSM